MNINRTNPRLIIGGDFNKTREQLQEMSDKGHHIFEFLLENCTKTKMNWTSKRSKQ